MKTTNQNQTRSEKLFERAQKVLPGGVSRNTILRRPHPMYVRSASGCRVTDVDGVTRLDFANNMASLIHGHADPEVVRAVTAQVGRGSAFTLATEVEIQYAEHLCSRSASFEQLRFVNSGTEAVMAAIKTARAFTGRSKIAKVEGAYHGSYDYAEVSQTATPDCWGTLDAPTSVPVVEGTPQGVLDDVVVLPFNDPERALELLNQHKETLACVLLDLMPHRVGLCPADRKFVDVLRDWTTKDGALLVCDEVITFRTEYGGAQVAYDLTPDLTALGKMIGGGFPIGALAGRADVMQVMNPHGMSYRMPFSGTFSANPVSTTAGLAAMSKFDQSAGAELNQLAASAMAEVAAIIAKLGVDASVTGAGSMFRLHMQADAPQDYRESFPSVGQSARLRAFCEQMLTHGVLMVYSGGCVLSTAMEERDIEAFLEAVERSFQGLGG